MFKGPYAGHEPTGETIEMYGMAIATVTDDLKVRAVICKGCSVVVEADRHPATQSAGVYSSW